MKTRYIVRRAGRSLKQAKVRTLLTSLAIAVGAFTLTVAIAAGEGSRQYAEKLISSNINSQALFVVRDESLVGGGGLSGRGGLKEYSETATQFSGLSIKSLEPEDLDVIENDKDIEQVIPTYLVEAQYMTFEGIKKKYTSDVSVYDASVLAESAAGTLPPLEEQIKDNEIVIPEGFLKALKIDNPKDIVGKKVTLRLVRQAQPSEEEITKTIQEKGPAGLAELVGGEVRDESFVVRVVAKASVTSLSASNALFISENTARDLSDFLTRDTPRYRSYVAATAIVKDGVDPEVVKQRLTDKDLIVRTAEDLQGLLFTIVNLLQGIVAGFGVLALIASVFGIINTQYISVLERTQQIGLMKALGMHSKDVAKLFRYEAAWIGFLGGVIGSVVAWGVGTVLNPWITEQLDLGAGNHLLVFELLPIVGLIIGLMVIAVIAGYFPARKAAKLDPIEALRTE